MNEQDTQENVKTEPDKFYTTKFRYSIKLDKDKAERTNTRDDVPEEYKDTKYVIHFKGELKFVDNPEVMWHEEAHITYEEALKVIEGTKGIKTITGIFKV